MPVFSTTVGKTTLSWSQYTLKDTLEGIAYCNKAITWIRSDLSTSRFSWLGRVFWIIAKHFHFLRSHLYHVDLEQSKAILQQLKPQVMKIDDKELSLYPHELTVLFNKAVNSFQQIARRHPVIFPAESTTPVFSTCTKLDLRNNIALQNFNDDDLKFIAEHFPNLETLNFPYSSCVITDKGLEHLAKLTHLESLRNFERCTNITDEGMKFLSTTKIEQLILPPQITSRGLAHLKTWPHLRSLDFAYSTGVTDASFQALIELPNLEELTLSILGPHVTAAGLNHLTKLTHLQKLNLEGWHNSFPDFFKQLSLCPELQQLSIQISPSITDVPPKIIINFPGNVMHAHPYVKRSLPDKYEKTLTNDHLQHLGQIQKLKYLYISGADGITSAGFQHLTNHPHLNLTLADCKTITYVPSLKDKQQEMQKILPKCTIILFNQKAVPGLTNFVM